MSSPVSEKFPDRNIDVCDTGIKLLTPPVILSLVNFQSVRFKIQFLCSTCDLSYTAWVIHIKHFIACCELVTIPASPLNGAGGHAGDDLAGGEKGKDNRRDGQQHAGCHNHAPFDIKFGHIIDDQDRDGFCVAV